MMRWIGGTNLVPLLCVLALLGAAVYSLVAPEPETLALDSISETRAAVEGNIVADPDIREQTVRLTIRPEKINGELVRAQTKIILVSDRFSDVRYGDRVSASGFLKRPKPFETDGGRTFDYPMYLRAHGISHEMSFAQVSILERGKGNPIVTALLSVKHTLRKGIEVAFPEPESSLLAGLLLGDKQSLGDTLTEAFRRAGIVHIIVLSGYNVSLVIAAVMFVANRFLAKGWALGLAALAIVAFAVMTGASETTLRASLMALIIILATALNRPALGLRILLIAAAVMALWNPFLVLFDLSFQLSVLATLGLIVFSAPIAERIKFVPESFGIREIVSATISTQLTVLPLLVLSVGSVSLVVIVANVLVLTAVPAAMLFGFIASVLAAVSYALSVPVMVVAYGILWYIIALGDFLGSLPFAAIDIPRAWTFPVLAVVTAACVFISWFFIKKQNRELGA